MPKRLNYKIRGHVERNFVSQGPRMIKNPLVERACVQILSHTEMSLGSLCNNDRKKIREQK